MKPCTRVGVGVTKRCGWRCSHCFYRWSKDFNAQYDKPIDELRAEISAAFARGCDHAVAVGWGEPSLYSGIPKLIEYCSPLGMSTSMITNGCAPLSRYEEYFNLGLDHLHLSVHGIGETLEKIAGVKSASKLQMRTIDWLAFRQFPWRANMTLQLTNYKEAPAVARHCISRGVFHFILLGFLPHYEWGDKALRDYLVHPAELRPYLEETIDECEQAGVHVTLRYHPFCHLDPRYWKYVVNARYVLYDPWEWDYGHCGDSEGDLWRAAVEMGDSVAVNGEPCSGCSLKMHCGGWNRTYAEAFHGAGLKAANGDYLTPEKQVPGYFHDQNPVNRLSGHIREDA